jgi:hypothetical protein
MQLLTRTRNRLPIAITSLPRSTKAAQALAQ